MIDQDIFDSVARDWAIKLIVSRTPNVPPRIQDAASAKSPHGVAVLRACDPGAAVLLAAKRSGVAIGDKQKAELVKAMEIAIAQYVVDAAKFRLEIDELVLAELSK